MSFFVYLVLVRFGHLDIIVDKPGKKKCLPEIGLEVIYVCVCPLE